MKYILSFAATAMIGLLTLGGCKKSSSSTPAVNASMIATINGAAYSATNCFASQGAPGNYGVSGITSGGNTIQMNIKNAAGLLPGTYAFDGVNNTASYQDATGTRYAKSGSITITAAVTGVKVVGTFSYTCIDGTTTTSITNGSFTATY